MCGHRGLELDSDLQIYEMSLTQEFRNHYDKILSPLSDEPISVGVANRRGECTDNISQGLVKTYNIMYVCVQQTIDLLVMGV